MEQLAVHQEFPRPFALPAVPPRCWTVTGRTRSPLARAVRAGSVRTGPAALAVVLGTDYRPADDALLLDAVARARADGLPLALLHEGAGGISLLRAAGSEDRALRFASVQIAARTPSALAAAPAAAAAALLTDRLGGPAQRGEVLIDGQGRSVTGHWRRLELPPGEGPLTDAEPAAGHLPGGGVPSDLSTPAGPYAWPGAVPSGRSMPTGPYAWPAAVPSDLSMPAGSSSRPGPVPYDPRGGRPVGPVLVTGGLGGLGLRAAAVVGAVTGARVLLLDVRDPGELTSRERRVLERVRSGPGGAEVLAADVTDPAAVAEALAKATGGPPATVVHCAGLIEGGRLDGLHPADLARLRAVKTDGLRNVLRATDRGALRQIVAFGSVISRRAHSGMGGYALANEVLRRETLRSAARLPGCAVVVAEWSLWSGAGEAHRMGVVKDAAQMGMPPVPLRPGMDALLAMLRRPPGPGRAAALVVTGAGDRGFPEPAAPAP
ncbi:KR domain-containing protein [Streptomyces sp. CA-111067]|uniref:KR domain-containing protein n=1 Tax=Streptomyces sp. CA-111067 TaxID=3240046 RepID=UPI003D95D5AA